MIFIHDIYKFIPTYRLTLSGYPTRETIHQIGVALIMILNCQQAERAAVDRVHVVQLASHSYGQSVR